jgi:hypothetical protein
MELIRKVYVDDNDFRVIGERFWIGEDEVSADDYMELLVGCLEFDEDECDGDCENCDECDDEKSDDEIEDIDDSDDAEFNMICAWADAINDNDLCEAHVYEVVQDAYMTGKRIGSRDTKLEMIERLNKEIDV